MKDIKYVHLKESGFILFSQLVTHQEVACKFRGDEVISAGFVNVNNNVFKCYGESISLNIGSLETDSEKLNRQFGLSF